MDWDNLASNDLPILKNYSHNIPSKVSDSFTVRSDLMKDAPPTTTHTNNMGTNTSGKLESIEDLIRRNERKLLTSLITQYNNESRVMVSKLIDDQVQEMWNQEKNIFLRDGRGGSSAIHTPLRTPNYITSNDTSIDPSYVLQHWKVVQRLGEQNISESIHQFSRIASDLSHHGVQSPSTILAYESTWQLISNIIAAPNTPLDQAKATLSHFCKQFQLEVSNCVRKASLVGHDTKSSYVNDIAAQCEVYARLTVGNTDPWTICFLCLRCGDAHAALHVLENIQTIDAVGRLLQGLVKLQGTMSCIWDSQSSVTQRNQSDLDDAISLSATIDETDTNVYQKAALTLILGKGSWSFNNKTKVGFKTVEDYLTGALWTSIVQNNPIDQIIQLGDKVVQLGPTYFNDPSSGGWSYTIPLLATQQYQTALLCLAEYGGKLGLLQSAHIGLILSATGTNIRDLGKGDTANKAVTNLIVTYCNEILKDFGSLAMLDYLVRIPNKVRSQKEISNLIANCNDIASLVGTLNNEGVRQGGVISKYLADSELSNVLLEAADLLSVFVDDQEKIGSAVMCLMLAGRYDDVLGTLNRLIAPPNIIDNRRRFWLDQVSLFHSHYISNRTQVLIVLERSGKTSLLRTSRLLMDLNLFFDRLRIENNSAECLSIAHKTHLLPSKESDRLIKECEYKELDVLVQEAFPPFLISILEILNKDYNQLKLDLRRDNGGVVRARLNEIKEYARLLVAFASSLNISSYEMEILMQLMSLLI